MSNYTQCCTVAHPEVTIHQGTLRGSTGTDLRGNPFLKFQGIPYAKPPVGDLRFKVKLSAKLASLKNLQNRHPFLPKNGPAFSMPPKKAAFATNKTFSNWATIVEVKTACF